MNKNHRRAFGFAVVAVGGALAACSVDTSDVRFVPDGELGNNDAGAGDIGAGDTGSGGAPDTGGVSNLGGVTNIAGVLNTGGALSKAGAGSGGVNPLGGSSSVGGVSSGGANGGSGGGVIPNMCPATASNPNEPVVDDVEDSDAKIPMKGGREGAWYVSNDGTPGGTQHPLPRGNPSDKPGAPSNGVASNIAMHTSGSGFTDWGANMGLTLLQPPGSGACPYNVSRQTGVRFWIRSELPNAHVRFVVPTTDTHAPAQGGTCLQRCGDHYGFDVTAPAMWTPIEVDFAELKQNGFGATVTFDKQHVLNLEWSVGPSAQFDFWIDQIEFY